MTPWPRSATRRARSPRTSWPHSASRYGCGSTGVSPKPACCERRRAGSWASSRLTAGPRSTPATRPSVRAGLATALRDGVTTDARTRELRLPPARAEGRAQGSGSGFRGALQAGAEREQQADRRGGLGGEGRPVGNRQYGHGHHHRRELIGPTVEEAAAVRESTTQAMSPAGGVGRARRRPEAQPARRSSASARSPQSVAGRCDCTPAAGARSAAQPDRQSPTPCWVTGRQRGRCPGRRVALEGRGLAWAGRTRTAR